VDPGHEPPQGISILTNALGRQANGGRLTEENVLDYFATSMFWDRTSDNQAMKMQMQFSEARPTDIAAELKSCVITASLH